MATLFFIFRKTKPGFGLTNGGDGGIIKSGSDKGADTVIETLNKARDINGYRQSVHNILSNDDIRHLKKK